MQEPIVQDLREPTVRAQIGHKALEIALLQITQVTLNLAIAPAFLLLFLHSIGSLSEEFQVFSQHLRLLLVTLHDRPKIPQHTGMVSQNCQQHQAIVAHCQVLIHDKYALRAVKELRNCWCNLP